MMLSYFSFCHFEWPVSIRVVSRNDFWNRFCCRRSGFVF